jgi:hypothetical protein
MPMLMSMVHGSSLSRVDDGSVIGCLRVWYSVRASASRADGDALVAPQVLVMWSWSSDRFGDGDGVA